jgi:formylglycine-generating enzyme required for sulfatase activity
MLRGLRADMVDIPAGTFRMGDLNGKGQPDEKPVHAVTLKGFRLMKHEVTFEQYNVYANAAGKPLRSSVWPLEDEGRSNRPAISVSWNDAQEFIAWLNAQTGLRYRLPTEAEWEYAARAGSSTDYPWGDTFDASRANGSSTGSAAVGSFPANAWGLHDMIGNVSEWTQDCYVSSYAGAPVDGKARIGGSCQHRVIRSGGWAQPPPLRPLMRVSKRSYAPDAYHDEVIGFRLAQDN